MGLGEVRLSNRKKSIFQLLSAAKGYRQQIGIIFVAMALGLVIVLNVAMAPSTTSEKVNAQLTYLKNEVTPIRSKFQ